MRVTVGPWLIECEPETTRSCYARIPPGIGCDCTTCRNVEALGPAAFPPGAHYIFEELGIDFHKPAEVYHLTRLENGLQYYGGWYHCVGHIESGPGMQPRERPSSTSDFERAIATEHFTLWCSSRHDLVPEPFRGLPLVQVEFTAELPWVISEPEPD